MGIKNKASESTSGRGSERFLMMEELVFKLQKTIRQAVEEMDKKVKFKAHRWRHHDQGGGVSMSLSGGKVFEKAGLNVSSIESTISPEMAKQLHTKPSTFRVCGISLIFHPYSPMIPTIHMNIRYFETKFDSWFGGGTDLTPYYPFEEDFKHFHQVTKKAVTDVYPKQYHNFKKACDDYFYLKHRQEMRGIGGVFFDYLKNTKNVGKKVNGNAIFNHKDNFRLVKSLGESFLDSYIPIVERRKQASYGIAEKSFQKLRRGRYVEFNLLYDRGTHFGLKTGGRVDSILVSLPPEVEFPEVTKFKAGSFQAKMNRYYKPRKWA